MTETEDDEQDWTEEHLKVREQNFDAAFDKFYETKFIDRIFNDVNVTVLEKNKFLEKFIPRRLSILGGGSFKSDEPMEGMTEEEQRILSSAYCDWIFNPRDLRKIINLHLKAVSKFKLIAKLGKVI